MYGLHLPMLSISPDSYIRLSLDQLRGIAFEHLMSESDDVCPAATAVQSAPAGLTGYTEWASRAAPRISMGWDWELLPDEGAVRLRRIGLPRSNIMLTGVDRADLGPDTTALLLGGLVDEMAWQDVTWRALGNRDHRS